MSWRSKFVLWSWDQCAGTHFQCTVHQSILVDSGRDHHCGDTCHHWDTCNADCSSCHMFQQGRRSSSSFLSNQAGTDTHLKKHIQTFKNQLKIKATRSHNTSTKLFRLLMQLCSKGNNIISPYLSRAKLCSENVAIKCPPPPNLAYYMFK
jgi:hypothetical protein